MANPVISLIVPVLNEEDSIGVFMRAVEPVLDASGYCHEIIFIDDGSSDATPDALSDLARQKRSVKVVTLSRNFGKEAALTAGLKYCSGDAVIPMDIDLQDPPELIPQLLEKWREGYRVVHACRSDRSQDSLLKRVSAEMFYRVMEGITDVSIPRDCGDFRLMDRAVVEAILEFPERNRFMKGIMACAGFKAARVTYARPVRAQGTSKFNFFRLWRFALDGITGFSTLPLRVWTYLGALVAFTAFVYAMFIIVRTLIFGVVTPGYASLMTATLFLGGIQLIGIGFLGEYLGRVVAETKGRPIYIVSETLGFSPGPAPETQVLSLAAVTAGRNS